MAPAAEAAASGGAHLAAAAGEAAPAPTAPKMVTMLELPAEYLRWVVAQRREHYRVPTLADYPPARVAEVGEESIRRVIAALQAAYDDFPALRAWARDVLEVHGGRVVVPEGKVPANARGVQQRVHHEWAAGAREELAAMAAAAAAGEGSGSGAGDDEEEEEEGDGDETTGQPLGPHLDTLSTYVALIYGYVSQVAGLKQ
ncbi:hypothetical protein ACP4OV_008888 [Aristida adscensionis]